MTVSTENYLLDIATRLKDLVMEMEKARPTNICYGFDETHMISQAWISMCLDYIKRETQ